MVISIGQFEVSRREGKGKERMGKKILASTVN
jgi:hypothetical protein